MNLSEIVTKKRINKYEKKELCRQIIDMALQLIEKNGKLVKISNIEIKQNSVNKGELNILYAKPFNTQEDDKYLFVYVVDIWYAEQGKVFSVRWADLDNVLIVKFKRGDWINILFQ